VNCGFMLGLVVLAAAAGCAEPPPERFVGQWYGTVADDRGLFEGLRLDADGRFTYSSLERESMVDTEGSHGHFGVRDGVIEFLSEGRAFRRGVACDGSRLSLDAYRPEGEHHGVVGSWLRHAGFADEGDRRDFPDRWRRLVVGAEGVALVTDRDPTIASTRTWRCTWRAGDTSDHYLIEFPDGDQTYELVLFDDALVDIESLSVRAP